MPLPPRVVFYDGVCALCHRVVRFLLRADRRRMLTFAPLQGETATELRKTMPNLPTDLTSVAYVEDGKLFVESRASARLSRHLPWPWRVAVVLGWLPRPLVDFFYRIVVRYRYRVFGKYEQCSLPNPSERARFLP
jgi:predicted DCC family thiol-disulfide oxidoreductase YuxK